MQRASPPVRCVGGVRCACGRRVQHLGVDLPGGAPLKVVIWHALIERYIESSGFHAWAHLHPTF